MTGEGYEGSQEVENSSYKASCTLCVILGIWCLPAVAPLSHTSESVMKSSNFVAELHRLRAGDEGRRWMVGGGPAGIHCSLAREL